jgi:carbon monoxide dehydrogenase subunit G
VPFAEAQVECFEFADTGGGTTIRWTLALDPRLIARLGARFATGAIRRLLARATANLDARLDAAVVR